MTLITCPESTCSLPSRIDIVIKPKKSALDSWTKVQGGTEDNFFETIIERSLIKAGDILQCDVGIEDARVNNGLSNVKVAHDCDVDDDSFIKMVNGMVDVISDEIEESKTPIKVNMNKKETPYLSADYEKYIIPLTNEFGECSVFLPSWISPDGVPRRTLIPTRQCIDKMQSALSSIGSMLERETDLWKFAKDEGEKVTIAEEIVGSYLFYMLKGKHPLSMTACQEMFDRKVIDGSDFSYSTPKTRTPDIPVDIKEDLEKLYPGRGVKPFINRIEHYVEDKRLMMSRKAGSCEIITQPLKNSEEISKSWVWFGNGDDLVIFNPSDAGNILKKRGYDVSVKSWDQDVTRSPSVKIEGLNCSLRDYQVDPICRWTKYVSSVLDSGDDVNVSWVRRKAGTRDGEKEVDFVESYTPPKATGGIIKAPTGAGKTIIGLVLMATQGAGVPGAVEVGK